MSAYLIYTPDNPEFAGKLFGLRFTNGKAVLTEETLDPYLGHTVDSILKDLVDFPGYKVRELNPRLQRAIENELEAVMEEDDGTETKEEVNEAGGRGKVPKAKKATKGKGS